MRTWLNMTLSGWPAMSVLHCGTRRGGSFRGYEFSAHSTRDQARELKDCQTRLPVSS